MKKICLFFNILFFNFYVQCSELDVTSNLMLNESYDLLYLIDSGYLDARELLLDKNFVSEASNDGFSKMFCLLQNIFSMTLDFSDDFNNINVRDNVLNAFADLANDLFSRVDLNTIAKEYPEEDFDFWQEFIKKNDSYAKNIFLKEVLCSLECSKVTNVVREIFFILAHYFKNCISIAVEHLQDSIFFEKTIKEAEFELRSKGKKRQIAASIFAAISQLCEQTGRIIGKPKQQGILSLFGTIFGTTAHIISVQSEQEIVQDEELAEQSKSWLTNKILSSTITKKIVSAILSTLQDYLHEKLEDFLDYAGQKLIDYICQKNNNKEEVIGNISNTDSGEVSNNGQVEKE